MQLHYSYAANYGDLHCFWGKRRYTEERFFGLGF